jgi:hypothetical protein
MEFILIYHQQHRYRTLLELVISSARASLSLSLSLRAERALCLRTLWRPE